MSVLMYELSFKSISSKSTLLWGVETKQRLTLNLSTWHIICASEQLVVITMNKQRAASGGGSSQKRGPFSTNFLFKKIKMLALERWHSGKRLPCTVES